MSEHKLAAGGRVICDPAQTPPRLHGVVYVIDRFGPVNAILSRPDGGRGLKIHPSALLPAPVAGAAVVTTVPLPLPPLDLGSVVTVASPRWTGGTELQVVLADYGDTVKLVRLGGNGGRYWPKVPRAWLTPVPADALRDAVAPLTGTAR